MRMHQLTFKQCFKLADKRIMYQPMNIECLKRWHQYWFFVTVSLDYSTSLEKTQTNKTYQLSGWISFDWYLIGQPDMTRLYSVHATWHYCISCFTMQHPLTYSLHFDGTCLHLVTQNNTKKCQYPILDG